MSVLRLKWSRPSETRRHIRKIQSNRCAICGEVFGSGKPTFEHVVPKALGGKNARNIVLTHERCNTLRGHAMPTGCLLIMRELVNTIGAWRTT